MTLILNSINLNLSIICLYTMFIVYNYMFVADYKYLKCVMLIFLNYYTHFYIIVQAKMPFRGALVSRDMYMGVSIDQMTNDGYFPTQKEHLHLLEGVSKNIWSNTPPPNNTLRTNKTGK